MPRHATLSHAFTLVVAVYNVEEYLPEFLASLDAQSLDPAQFDVVFVVDGSPDDSEQVIRDWAAGSAVRSEVLVQPNGGVSSARNAGLDRATGDWVAFPDPDDVLDPDYLLELQRAVATEGGDERLFASRLLQFSVDTAKLLGAHPLDWRFSKGLTTVDLGVSPKHIHLHAASATFNRGVIESHGLRFVEGLHIFEDATFTAHYLLALAAPLVTVVPNAKYFYRKREDSSSVMQSVWSRPDKYSTVLEKGHLALLTGCTDGPPIWLQYLVIYDIQWYPRADERNVSETAAVPHELLVTLHDLLRQILSHVQDSCFLTYNSTGVPLRIRLALLALKGSVVTPDTVHVVQLDRYQRLLKIDYFTSDPNPVETVRYDGVVAEPTFAKTIALVYFRQPWLYRRELWVSALNAVSVEVEGRNLPIEVLGPFAPIFETDPAGLWRRFTKARFPVVVPRDPEPALPRADRGDTQLQDLTSVPVAEDLPSIEQPPQTRPRRRRRLKRPAYGKVARKGAAFLGVDIRINRGGMTQAERMSWLLRLRSTREKYRDAWVLIDRDTMAHDNAEAFYRYLRDERPDVNAWFVLSQSSSDWERLEKDGFRLVDHGSIDHVLLMKRASYLISSQIDRYIVNPYSSRRYGRGSWKYVFLQHGVTHNDLSRWINGKPVSLLLTATPKEHESIVRDGSPYRYSDKETRLTGFPRHDALQRKAEAVAPEQRNLVLVMPTWRQELQLPAEAGHMRRLREDFAETTYVTQWRAFLGSERLRRAAEERGLEICFAPHPNFQLHLDAFEVPDHVRVVKYSEVDVQETIARARVMVTDYSSLAFEAAFLETPVAYFQFDRDDFFSGKHAFRRGEFSYEDDGFGPVRHTVEAAVDATVDLVSEDGVLLARYADRLRDAFAHRDGRASERVFAEIAALRDEQLADSRA